MSTICLNTKNAIDEINKILTNKQDVVKGLEYIKLCLLDIKTGGQKLEDRCQEYKDCIESLGFKRDKKRKRK